MIDPNPLFFGNSVDAAERLSHLEQFREYLDCHLRAESEYMSSLHSDLEIDMIPLFAETFPPILHSSIITSTVSLVELELRGYCEAMRTSLGLVLRMNELSGSLLERFWRYCTKVAGLSLDPDALRWSDLVSLFELRNCLVHTGGDLASFWAESTLRSFAGEHGTPMIENDHLVLNSATSVLGLGIASEFLDRLFDIALARFPGRYNPRQSGKQ